MLNYLLYSFKIISVLNIIAQFQWLLSTGFIYMLAEITSLFVLYTPFYVNQFYTNITNI